MSRNTSEENPKSPEAFRLGAFSFSLKSGELREASGAVVHLRRQCAQVLACLLRRRGELVTKDELFESVWAGTVVTDDSLVQCISEIRRVLNDGDRALVRTAPGKGYGIAAVPAVPGGANAALPLPDRPSIAVLAFEDYSAGSDAGYLSDAIAEGIIAELSRFPELFVIARNSSFSLRHAPMPVAEISRALGVRYLLEGSQQKHGDRLRVTVQLIDAVDGRHLWSDVYARDLNDLFEVQDDIVRRVVATVAQKVISFEGSRAGQAADGSEEGPGPGHGEDAETAGATRARRASLLHHLHARQHLVKFTPEDNARALEANLAAIRADPTQPFGYAGLAFVHINGHRWGWTTLSRAEALDAARRAARTALDLTPDYYDGHAAMAYVHLQDDRLDLAIARARRALALNPNDTNVMSDLAEFLGYDGQLDEAEALVRTAMRRDPLHPDWMLWNLAWIQWLKGDCRGALSNMEAMKEIPPMANRVLAVIHVDLGQLGAARAAVARLMAFDPGYSMADVRRNYCGKFRQEADLARMMTALQAAGLPG